jgi:rSAM/selenodomain-associated transferase 1
MQGFAAYTPVGQEAAFDGLLPPSFQLLPQRGSDLGERLFHAAEDLFAGGYESICLINSDSPTLPTGFLRTAVEALRTPGDRVVLGEAADGGYYLIGLKSAHRRLFEEIAWSTNQVFSQTSQRASEIHLKVERLPVWYDVDDAESLRLLCAELFHRDRVAENVHGSEAPCTREFLRNLIESEPDDRLRLLSGSNG